MELDKDKEQEAKDGAVFAQNLKSQIKELEDKLDTLLDTHLDETITKEEYTAKKQKILNHKIEISEKLKDFEQNGDHWLEPAKKFILDSKQAEIIALQENLFIFNFHIDYNNLLIQNQAKLTRFIHIPTDLACAELAKNIAEIITKLERKIFLNLNINIFLRLSKGYP